MAARGCFFLLVLVVALWSFACVSSESPEFSSVGGAYAASLSSIPDPSPSEEEVEPDIVEEIPPHSENFEGAKKWDGDLKIQEVGEIEPLDIIDNNTDYENPRRREVVAPVTYRGGPVMKNAVPVYVIWFGSRPQLSRVGLVRNFLRNFDKSSWYKTNTAYYDNSGRVNGKLYFAGDRIYDSTFPLAGSTSLSSADIIQIVFNVVINGKLPIDENAIYIVLTSPEVNIYDNPKNAFCSSYCGYHSYMRVTSGAQSWTLKYALAGDPARCMGACARQSQVSPNGDPPGDAQLSIVAHEIAEMVTDPELNAWLDNQGNEGADKCQWRFLKTNQLPNGALYNVQFAWRRYYIQANWKVNGQFCSLT